MELITAAEFSAREIERERRELKGIRSTKGYLILTWGGYEYDIEWDRIDSPGKLLGWIHHLCEKNWMDTYRMFLLIEHVGRHCGFKPWELGA